MGQSEPLEGSGGPRQVFRVVRQMVFWTLGCGVFLFGMAVASVARQGRFSLEGLAVALVFTLLGMLVGLGWVGVGVTLTEAEMVVHGYALRRRRVPWNQIAEIGTTTRRGRSRVTIRLVDGKRIRLLAPAAGPMAWAVNVSTFDFQVQRMRQWHAAASNAVPAGSVGPVGGPIGPPPSQARTVVVVAAMLGLPPLLVLAGYGTTLVGGYDSRLAVLAVAGPVGWGTAVLVARWLGAGLVLAMTIMSFAVLASLSGLSAARHAALRDELAAHRGPGEAVSTPLLQEELRVGDLRLAKSSAAVVALLVPVAALRGRPRDRRARLPVSTGPLST